jgi:hypothetical protein
MVRVARSMTMVVLLVASLGCSSGSGAGGAVGGESLCDSACAGCGADPHNLCKTSCVAYDHTAQGVGCGNENEAHLSCITGQGACYSDQDGADATMCTEEKETLSTCFNRPR